MGRPPFGERAMTAAEKQARYRAKKFGNSVSVTNTAPRLQRTRQSNCGRNWPGPKSASPISKPSSAQRRQTAF